MRPTVHWAVLYQASVHFRCHVVASIYYNDGKKTVILDTSNNV